MNLAFMKNILRILLVFFCAGTASAQNINNYIFTAVNGVFTPLPAAATSPTLTSGSLNEGFYNNIPIGFDFYFLTRRVTTVAASTNGWLSLSNPVLSSAVAANNMTSFNASTDLVAPLWDDLDLTSGSFKYQTTGIAPNRVFTAEWRNVEWNWNANTSVISFQVKLFESTGQIQFEYQQEAGAISGGSATIGIRGIDISSQILFQTLSATTTSPSINSTISINNLNTKPATGQIYRFLPNSVNTPGSFSTNGRTINSMNVTWSDLSTNETGFVVYRSTDNINFVFEAIVPANTTFLNVQNLISGTTYFYRIFSINEGRLSNALNGSASTLLGTLSGVLNVPGNYNSITSALNAIRVNGMAGPITIQLNSNYNSANESFPILISSIGTAANRVLTIRPAANVTSLNINSTAGFGVFEIRATNFVTIDGRPGGVGSTRALNLNCPNGTNTVLYTDDCSNDTIRFCRLSLNDNSPTFGGLSSVISFNVQFSGFVTGSNNNAIINNEIFGINPPSNLILFSTINSFNTVTSQNNTISNNILYDYSGLIRFFSGNAAINVEGNVTNFNINNNVIYQTNSITAATSFSLYQLTGIRVNSTITGNFNINNNIIGGSNATASGNPWELGPVTEFNVLGGIDVSVNGSTSLQINNNTIRNFFLGTNTAFVGSPAFFGINFISSQKATNVSIANNNIGRDTGNTSISVTNEGQGLAQVVGIKVDAADASNVNVANNNIGSFNLSGPNPANGFQFVGISMSSSGTVNANTIGSTTTPNSIIISTNGSNSNQQVIGISNTAYTGFNPRTEDITISNNIISGLRNNFNLSTTTDRVIGIDLIDSRSLNVQGNTIQQLSTLSSSSFTNIFTVKGIQINNTANSNPLAFNINNNVIRNLQNISASGLGNVVGMVLNNTAATQNFIGRNFIHSFEVISQNNLTQQIGINIIDGETRITNNMIRLGINNAGLSNLSPSGIIGIELASPDQADVWHNTIYIGGNILSSPTATYALRRTGNGNVNLINNVLSNQRRFNSTTASPINFCIGLTSSSLFTASTNCYFRSGTGTSLGQIGSTSYDTITTWRTATATDAGSGNVNPNFVNPIGNGANVDLHVVGVTPVESNGTPLPLVLVDFDGQTRANLSPVDVGADAGNFTTTPLPVKWGTFTAVKKQEKVYLNFTVIQQINNDKFVVERSLDNQNFLPISIIKGDMNTSIIKSYQLIDELNGDVLEAQKWYYRIKQIDADGGYAYSITRVLQETTSIKSSVENGPVAYPVPCNESLNLLFTSSESPTNVQVFNHIGNLILELKVNAGVENLVLETQEWPVGIYIIKFNHLSEAIRVVKAE